MVVPEIADFEVRRELLRAGKVRGLQRPDALKRSPTYVPLTPEVMLQGAAFWAEALRQGKRTADPNELG